MKAYIILILLVVTAIAAPSIAQQHSLQLEDGSGNVDLLVASGSGSNFTFPAGDGTVITNNNVGTFAWATNGITMSGALPGNPVEYFGSVNGGDVIMKAYGNEQLRLLSTGGLQLPATTSAGAGTVFQGGSPIMHTYGTGNVFTGANAGNLSMTGANNAACGASALSANTSGSGNTGSGNGAGAANTTGSENTFIGHGANASAGNFSNATAIGAGAMVGQSNSIVLGNNASVGIGTPTPSQKLEVNGNILANGVGTGNITGTGTVGGNIVNSTTNMTAGGTIAGNVVNSTTTMTAGGTITGNVVNSTTTMTAGGTITGNDLVATTTVTATGNVNILGQNGIHIVEGANGTMGIATLVAGTVVVNTNKVTANSRIFLTIQTDNGAPATVGVTYVSARAAGNNFTITSNNAADVSSVAWIIIEP